LCSGFGSRHPLFFVLMPNLTASAMAAGASGS
jgi:hypothetical protein